MRRITLIGLGVALPHFLLTLHLPCDKDNILLRKRLLVDIVENGAVILQRPKQIIIPVVIGKRLVIKGILVDLKRLIKPLHPFFRFVCGNARRRAPERGMKSRHHEDDVLALFIQRKEFVMIKILHHLFGYLHALLPEMSAYLGAAVYPARHIHKGVADDDLIVILTQKIRLVPFFLRVTKKPVR